MSITIYTHCNILNIFYIQQYRQILP